MEKNDLKIFAGFVVKDSRLPKQAKLQILEWIKNEASEVDVMAFLMDGQIQHINENSSQVVIDRFKTHKAIQEAYREFEGMGKKFLQYGIAILATNVAWPLGAFGMWLYRKATDTCVKNCGGISQATTKCVNMCYLNASKKVLDKFKSEKGNLNKIKDEKKRASAAKKLDKQIQKWEDRVEKYETRVRSAAQDIVVTRQ